MIPQSPGFVKIFFVFSIFGRAIFTAEVSIVARLSALSTFFECPMTITPKLSKRIFSSCLVDLVFVTERLINNKTLRKGPFEVSAQKEGALADSQHKARFLTFVRNDKQFCHFDRREKSLAPGVIEFPRIIE